jgi:hypothetical protein
MEIAQFHLSNIKSGMFPSMAINMANGIPTREERRTIERQINAKFGGSGNAGKILLTFNDGKDTAPEIVPINANDNSESYQFLSTETTRKVLTGHRVTSPLLFGVKGDGSGFGNNADELRDSYSLFNNTVIKPFQNTLLSGLEPILHANDINLDLYFKTLKPADFIDLENTGKLDEDEQEKEGIDTGDEIKKEFGKKHSCKADMPVDDEQGYIEYFTENAIKLDDDWEELRVDRAAENEEDEEKFYKFATDVPGGDTAGNLLREATKIGLFKLYYRYSSNISSKSRDFCRIMVALRKARNVYTRKSIINAGSRAVNPGFGKNGSNTYSIWKFKGGAYCHHFWDRVWYFRKRVPAGEQIEIDGKTYKGGQVLPDTTIRNYRKVSNAFAEGLGANMPFDDTLARTKPIDTPTRGKYS